jgi:hypothetical protein
MRAVQVTVRQGCGLKQAGSRRRRKAGQVRYGGLGVDTHSMMPMTSGAPMIQSGMKAPKVDIAVMENSWWARRPG